MLARRDKRESLECSSKKFAPNPNGAVSIEKKEKKSGRLEKRKKKEAGKHRTKGGIMGRRRTEKRLYSLP